MSAYNFIHSFYVMSSYFGNNFFQNGSPSRLDDSILFVIPDLIRNPVFYIDRLVGCAEFFKKCFQSFAWTRNSFSYEIKNAQSKREERWGGMRSSQFHYYTPLIGKIYVWSWA